MSDSVLVTGGAGFIGSHLVTSLLNRGQHVTVIDDLSTGRWQNLSDIQDNPRLRVLIASVTDQQLVEQEVREHDFVYHLASAVGVKLIIEQPIATVETIVECTNTVLRSCSRYRVPILITSTSEVYGKSTEVPFCEENDVVLGATEKRRWSYACAKAVDEFLALAFYYETRLPVFIVRLFNTVGPRQASQYGMVLPTFVKQALAGEPITVYGDGTQTRCFCSVFDVVEGLVALPDVPEAAGKVVNLGSQEEIAIKELAQRVKDACNSDSEIRFIPYEDAYGPGFDDMMRRVPSLSRIRRFIDWDPKHNIDHIIREVVEFTKSQGHIGST